MAPWWRSSRGARVAITAIVVIAFVLIAGSPVLASADGDEPIHEAENVVIQITVNESGDAQWRVEYWYGVSDGNESTGFEALRASVENESSHYVDRFTAAFEESVAAAERYTDRNMSLVDPEVEAATASFPHIEGKKGVVSYQFTWKGFAEPANETYTIGDALHGLYLSPEATLIITWPTPYTLAGESAPGDDSVTADRVLWHGERHFDADEPRIHLETDPDAPGAQPPDENNVTDGNDEGGENETGDREDGLFGTGMVLGVGLLVVALGSGAAFVVWRSKRSLPDSAALPGLGTEDHPPEQGTDSPAVGDSPPPELLSNEELVMRTLTEHGGRIKQQTLAEECGWHASKTSKVVTSLKENGRIDVFRLGRENIITLPEQTGGDADDAE